MPLLWYTDPRCGDHDPGAGHPERPERLAAVAAGVAASGAADEIEIRRPGEVADADLLRVHDRRLLDAALALDEAGGGRIDPDTAMGPGSLTAARLAAGAGIDAIAALQRGDGEAAFVAVRPPGHHATPSRSMGFCLFNNVAVCAAALRSRGERVAVVDIDVHHGNGTQDCFVADPDVLFVSVHQQPLYPGTGALDEVGVGEAEGTTINLPVPPGTGRSTYRALVDRVVGPALARFGPDWLLLSVGFDGHLHDPLADLVLVADDYADLVGVLTTVVPEHRLVAFLEGGYDLDALTRSTAAVAARLVGARHRDGERPPNETDSDVVDRAVALHQL